MAIDFPNSPTDGQSFTSGTTKWIYNAAAGKWHIAAVETSTTTAFAPIGTVINYMGGSAPNGWLLCNGQSLTRSSYPALFGVVGTTYGQGSNPGTTFALPQFLGTTGIYIIRATDEAVTLSTASNLLAMPVGTMSLFAMSSIPTGWLRCDGSAVSRTSYADLYSAIGTTYGTGDGSTTFNLPNIAGSGSGSPLYYIKAILSGDAAPATVAHASSHIRTGSDVIDGDRVQVDYVPSAYTRDSSATEAGANTDLTAHLKGIDNRLGTQTTIRNRVINGSFIVDQRNSGAAQTITAGAALAYTADRWYAYCTGANVTGQRVAGSTPFQNYYRLTGAASNTVVGFGTRLESADTIHLANTTATLSAYIASTSLASITWTAYYANTTDAFGTVASPTRTQIATGTFALTSTLTRYSTQINVPLAATTGIEILFTTGAFTSGTLTFAGVQFEQGVYATPFEFPVYTQELRLCQRYYERSDDPSRGITHTLSDAYWNSPDAAYSWSKNGAYYDSINRFATPKRTNTYTITYWGSTTTNQVHLEQPGITNSAENINVNNSQKTYSGFFVRHLSSLTGNWVSGSGNAFMRFNWEVNAEL